MPSRDELIPPYHFNCRREPAAISTVIIGGLLFPVFFYWESKIDPLDALLDPAVWDLPNFTLLSSEQAVSVDGALFSEAQTDCYLFPIKPSLRSLQHLLVRPPLNFLIAKSGLTFVPSRPPQVLPLPGLVLGHLSRRVWGVRNNDWCSLRELDLSCWSEWGRRKRGQGEWTLRRELN